MKPGEDDDAVTRYAPPRTRDPLPWVVTAQRAYASVFALVYLAGAAITGWLGKTVDDRWPWLVVLFVLLALTHAASAAAPRRPWSWTLAFCVLGFGVTSVSIVFALPLLVAWRGSLVRAAYQRA